MGTQLCLGKTEAAHIGHMVWGPSMATVLCIHYGATIFFIAITRSFPSLQCWVTFKEIQIVTLPGLLANQA